MVRARRALFFAVLLGGVAALGGAGCDSSDGTCSVDTDCASGLVCRAGACVGSADAAPVDSGSACGDENAACGATTNPSVDAAPSSPRCAALYELCLTNDQCCLGLTCQSGACR